MVKALRDHVERMVVDLSDVLARLRRRLRWAMAPITRLGALIEKQGPLGPIDYALFKRCDRVIRKLKGMTTRTRRDAEGYDDVKTFSVLAAEGFLPGYGLEVGAVLCTGEIPFWRTGAMEFSLPRPPFNDATNFLVPGHTQTIVYGPYGAGCPNCSVAPTFSGPATNIGQRAGAQATGNLTGWVASNQNLAFLTGIIQPQGVDDPYVYNQYLSLQREVDGKWVLEADYVGTAGHKLFRSENINSIPGGNCPSEDA